VEEEEFGAVVLVGQVLSHPGVDDGGKRSGVTSVGLCGSQHQVGEGGGGGATPQGQWRRRRRLQGKGGERGREVGEEVCRAVLVLVMVVSIIHNNNTYFTSIPFLV
jgi:hypothetical protein